MKVKRVFSQRSFAKQWDDLTVEDLDSENYPDNELSTIESFKARPDFTWSEQWELVGKGEGQEPFVVVRRRWNGDPLDVYPPEKWEDIKEEYDFACGGKKKFSRRPKGYLCRNFSNEDKAFEVLEYRLKDLARIVDKVMSYIEEDKDIFKDGNAPEDATRALAKLLWEADGSWLEPEYMRALKRRLAVYH